MKKFSTLKIPPPILFILSIILMVLLPKVCEFTTNWYGVLIFLCISFIIACLSVTKFVFNAQANISPIHINKTTHLFTGGIYQYSRNPMYLSLAIALCSFFFYLGNLLAILGIPFFIYSTTIFQIKAEERFLTQQFGQKYLTYKTKVRRWF